MTPNETAAFNAGIKHAIGMAQLAALQIELRLDAGHIRQRAASEALRGLVEGLKAGLPDLRAEATNGPQDPLIEPA